jgi:hypothetical protein
MDASLLIPIIPMLCQADTLQGRRLGCWLFAVAFLRTFLTTYKVQLLHRRAGFWSLSMLSSNKLDDGEWT